MYNLVAIILEEAPAEVRTLKIFDGFNGSSILNFSIDEDIEEVIKEHILKHYNVVSREGNAFILTTKVK